MVEHPCVFMSGLRHLFTSVMKDQSGSIALLLLFAFMLIFGSVALAIDVTRYISLQSKAEDAALAAVRVAAKNRDILNSENLEAFVREFAESSIANSGLGASGLSGFLLEEQDAGRGMTVKLSVQFPVTLMQIFNTLDELTINVSKSAVAEIQNTEISLIIDRSDHMTVSGKMETLKDAASSFTELIGILSSEDDSVRLGIIPMGNQYANIKPYSEWVLPSAWPTEIPPAVPGMVDWVGSLEQQRWCADIRAGEAAENDSTPSIETFPLILEISKEPGEMPASDLYSITTSADCSDLPLRPLNTDFEAMDLYFSRFNGHGKTAGGRAFLWGERLLSPGWQTHWNIGADIPAAYELDVRKILLFVGGSSFDASSEESRIFKETCARMKVRGIVMYMVDFNAPAVVVELMKECGSTAGHFYKAEDANSLNRIFKEIARSLSTLKKISLN
ncbi:MAG: hypothetical protein V7750_04855 [Sneathiella sp.]